MTDDYDGPERRIVTKSDIALMVEEAVEERMSKMEDKLMSHMDVKFGQLHRIFEVHVEDAFPAGPLHRHREYHQGLIDNAEVVKRIRQDLLAWVFKGGIGLFMFLVGMGALEWLKRELTK